MTKRDISISQFRIDVSNEYFGLGAVEYFHGSDNRNGTAYELDEDIKIIFSLPKKLGSSRVKIHLVSEYENETVEILEASRIASCGDYEKYEITVPTGRIGVGIYFFFVEIFGIAHMYGFKEKQSIRFSELCEGEKFQLSICNFKYQAPSDRYGGIIYHIFVDRFSRGGEVPLRENAVFVEDWNSDVPEYPEYPGAFLKNNYFYGGTLYGIKEKLDYISSLGVNIIYLSPIFEAYSNHKYDVGDYSKIDDMFGGEAALSELISACDEKGIAIVLDGVFNHTGADSKYFNKFATYSNLGAYQSENSPYYEWYDFQSYPDKYTAWWGIEILPRINPEKEHCRNYFVGKDGIIEKYTAMGIKGFRLDVVDELSDGFISDIRRAQTSSGEATFLYGEVWEDASNKIAYGKRKHYYLGGELDGVMNYPLRRGIIEYVRNKNTSDLEYALLEVYPNMPKCIRDFTMNLLGTHDTERILTVLGGDTPDGKSNSQLYSIRLSKEEYKVAKRRLMLAYTILATLPGIPTIFYGDEAGMQGYSDPFNRRTYPWDNVDKEILEFYRKIGGIRNSYGVYKDGDFRVYELSKDALVFSRFDGENTVLTVANNSESDFKIKSNLKTVDLVHGRKEFTHTVRAESALILLCDHAATFEIFS